MTQMWVRKGTKTVNSPKMVQIWLKTVLKWPKYDLEKVQKMIPKWSQNSSNDSTKVLLGNEKKSQRSSALTKDM